MVLCWVGVAAPAQLYSRLMASRALAQYGSERWKRAWSAGRRLWRRGVPMACFARGACFARVAGAL